MIEEFFYAALIASTVIQLAAYAYTGIQIHRRPQTFLQTLWAIFTVMSVLLVAYSLLFSWGPYDLWQVGIWYVVTNLYAIGHFMFSYQYLMSAIDIEIYMKLEAHSL